MRSFPGYRSAAMLMLGVVIVTLAATGAAGCGGAQPSLAGTAWRLTGWSVSSLDPADFTITADFGDDQVGGRSAVNSYGGPYESDTDGSFSVGALAATEMAGPEPAMRAEGAYLELLGDAAAYSVTGQTLTLSDANGNELLIFAARE